jgi:hypothetical protein
MNTHLLTDVQSLEGLTQEHATALAEILADVRGSMERLARAARKWVDLPEKVRAKIISQTAPSFRDFWLRLEKVGSGTLHPQLATVGGLAARLLGRLPLEDQTRYLSELMPVVVAKGRGWDQRLVDVAVMSEDQRKQVFKMAADGSVTVRDVEAQKVYIAEKAARRLLQNEAMDGLKKIERQGWRVEKGRVWLKEPLMASGINRRQLERMLADLSD